MTLEATPQPFHEADRLRQQYTEAQGELSLDDLIELAARRTANVELLGEHAFRFTFDDGSILEINRPNVVAYEQDLPVEPRILQVQILDEQGERVSHWWTPVPYKTIVEALHPIEVYDSLEELQLAQELASEPPGDINK